MGTVPDHFYRQSGVIPHRTRSGVEEVLLITSMKRGRWIIPKGIIEPGLTPAESALVEAREEAGIEGTLDPEPLGTYEYDKWEGTCTVTVFLMHVTREHTTWPEAAVRERRWVAIADALKLVENDDIRALISRSKLRNIDY